MAKTKKPKAKAKPKAAPTAVEDVDASQLRLDDLHPAQRRVLQGIAEWERPADIRAEVTDALADGTLSEPWIRKVCSPVCRPAWARPIVAQFRKEFLAARDTIACRHSAYRMRKLQEIIERTDDDRTRLAAVREAFEQSGDKVERVADVSDAEALDRIMDKLRDVGGGNGSDRV